MLLLIRRSSGPNPNLRGYLLGWMELVGASWASVVRLPGRGNLLLDFPRQISCEYVEVLSLAFYKFISAIALYFSHEWPTFEVYVAGSVINECAMSIKVQVE